MEYPRFNPSQSVKFDLANGAVSIDGSGSRLLIPADLLTDLWANSAPEQRRDFGRRLGTELGRRVGERLGGNRADRASLEAVVEHLGGDFALTGLGSMHVERWGRALVVAIQGSPFGAAGDDLLAAIVEGAIQRLFGKDTGVVVLVREQNLVRLLVLSPNSALRARSWLDAGDGWGDVLSRLHADAAGGA
jgi:hypothetical protein